MSTKNYTKRIFKHEITERIEKIRHHFGFTKREFCSKLKFSETNYNNITSTSRESKPPAELLEKIAKYTKVNYEWLLTGKGNMISEESEPQIGVNEGLTDFMIGRKITVKQKKLQGERLAKAIEALNIRKNRFAKDVNLGSSHVSEMCRGNRLIKDYHLLLFEKIHKINRDFILGKSTVMFLSETFNEEPLKYLNERFIAKASSPTRKLSNSENMLGKNLKTIRKALNIRQYEFAKKLNTSPGYLSEVESGKKIPGSEFLYSLKQVFGVSLDELFKESGKITMLIKDHAEEFPSNSEVFQLLKNQISELREDKNLLKSIIEKQDKQIAELKRELDRKEAGNNSA